MNLYNTQGNNLKEVKELSFKLEKDIQLIFENNLENIMGLQLVKSEFTIKNKRIDTLAYDAQSKAFIIIEYKRSKSVSVVDQGFTYLSLMFENKADFIVEYNESQKESLKRSDIDWSQTRVVFVSTGFTDNQKTATNFKDIAIELWEVKKYEGGLISVNQIKKSRSAESIKPITSSNSKLEAVTKEIIVYTEEDHTKDKSDQISELYETYRDSIVALADDIEIIPKKLYVAFKKRNRNIAYLHLQKKNIKLWINAKWGEIEEPSKIAHDVSNKGHYGYGDYEIDLKDDSKIEYIMSLIKQAI
jgi:predicted transport protein